MKYKFNEILMPYVEKNAESLYEPVAVGRYGIRKRSEIYKKELSKDYSKNKVIRKDTLIIGMGSVQIDFGVLSDDCIYSVSPAYHTFFIDTKKIESKFLELLLKAKNKEYTNKYMIASARQGKKVDIVNFLNESINIPSFDIQAKITKKIYQIETAKKIEDEQLRLYDELVKSRFAEMFTNKGFDKVPLSELAINKVSTAKKDFNQEDKIKYIDISSIDNQKNLMTGFTEYALKDAPSRAQQHIFKNDIVVSTVRPNLRNVAITSYDYDNLVASSGFCVLRAKNGVCPEYIMSIVCSDDFTNKMSELTTGANYPAIHDLDVMNYIVENPPLGLQKEFSEFCKQINKSKLICQKKIELYQELIDKKMDEYLN